MSGERKQRRGSIDGSLGAREPFLVGGRTIGAEHGGRNGPPVSPEPVRSSTRRRPRRLASFHDLRPIPTSYGFPVCRGRSRVPHARGLVCAGNGRCRRCWCTPDVRLRGSERGDWATSAAGRSRARLCDRSAFFRTDWVVPGERVLPLQDRSRDADLRDRSVGGLQAREFVLLGNSRWQIRNPLECR